MELRALPRWRKERPVYRIRASLWLAAGVLGTIAVAGQALGPVLAGPATGNAGIVASQSMRFMTADAAVIGSPDLNQANAAVDTAGLILEAAFRMHRGEDGILRFQVANASDATRSAYLSVTRPGGSGVDLSSTDPDVGLAQMGLRGLGNGEQTDLYLLTVGPEGYGDLDLHVQVGTADPLGSFNIELFLQETP